MILANLRGNMLSAEAFAWYKSYLEAMDSLDVDRYGSFLAQDIELSFNNAAPITGKAQVLDMLEGYWRGFASIEHDLLNIYGDDRSFALEAFNHYQRHDGRRVTVRAVACTDRNEAGLARSVRVYADASPVFAA